MIMKFVSLKYLLNQGILRKNKAYRSDKNIYYKFCHYTDKKILSSLCQIKKKDNHNSYFFSIPKKPFWGEVF